MVRIQGIIPLHPVRALTLACLRSFGHEERQVLCWCADATHLTNGQVLGGSSALNFLAWDRASTVEYDTWEKLGNKGWVSTTMKQAADSDINLCRIGSLCTHT